MQLFTKTGEQNEIYLWTSSIQKIGFILRCKSNSKKTCNYSCIYCQLGRTNHMTNNREMFYPVNDIITELKAVLKNDISFDIITIVGEGEPTLYLGLGDLIIKIKALTNKAVAIITNGALLYDSSVRSELLNADIVLPTFDAYDQESFQKINRPHGSIKFNQVFEGLQLFSKEYKGKLWVEMMFLHDINDSENSIKKYKQMLSAIVYDRLYLNTPVRPPAEGYVEAVSKESMLRIQNELKGISIDLLDSEGFYSDISNHQDAIYSIIKRHPMNQFEIRSFLKSRNCEDIDNEMIGLENNSNIESISYKGYTTYRLK